MQKLIIILAGLGLVALCATASLAEAPGDTGEQDVVAEEETQEAPQEMERSKGEPAGKPGVRASSKEKRRGMKQDRKRGLDRADEVAGEHGKHGRDKARQKGKR